jgi:hypothetical protein
MHGAVENRKLAALPAKLPVPGLALPLRLGLAPLGSRVASPRTANDSLSRPSSAGSVEASRATTPGVQPPRSLTATAATSAGPLSARRSSPQHSGLATARSAGIGSAGSRGGQSGGLLLRPEESRSGHSTLGTSGGGFSGNAAGAAAAKALGAIAETLRAEAHGDVVLRLMAHDAEAAADQLLVAAEVTPNNPTLG